MFEHRYRLDSNLRPHPGIVHEEQKAPSVTQISLRVPIPHTHRGTGSYIFLISRLGMFMQLIISGKRATMSLLLMVMFATIFLRATFLTE